MNFRRFVCAAIAWWVAALPVAHALDPTDFASWHTFYLDIDQDSYGDRGFPFPFSTAAPPGRLWAPHADDIDDTNPFSIPLPVPRGQRILGLDFALPAADGKWRPDLARELGVQATPLHLFWNLIESGAGRYDGPQAAVLESARYYAGEGIAVSLTVHLTSGAALALPADLQSTVYAGQSRLSDPAVLARLEALLAFVHERLQGVELVSLQLGHEVDRLAGREFLLPDYVT